MDSARSYHASKTSVRRFEITDYQTGLTDVSTKGQKTPEGEDTAQNTGEQENTAENTAMTAKDWQSRFLVSSARWNMRSSASEQTLSTIREYTVRYIFDLLFPSRNSTLHDWMQENGWSGGNSHGNTCIGCISSGDVPCKSIELCGRELEHRTGGHQLLYRGNRAYQGRQRDQF